VVIHEASHLLDGVIYDLVYMQSPRFGQLEEQMRVKNAAHYEVLAARLLGAPGPASAGPARAVTASETVMKGLYVLSDAYQHAWEMYHALVKVRKSGHAAIAGWQRYILESASIAIDLTLHTQNTEEWLVTTTDLAVFEGFLRRLKTARAWAEANVRTLGGSTPRDVVEQILARPEHELLPGRRLGEAVEVVNWFQTSPAFWR
jgi:hypothetical protein